VEVQDLTAREVQVMARTAASFFDAVPLPEFTSALLPTAARQLRRMRHRILHRTVHTTSTGTMIHAMLLGRDGVLRLFSARTADSRDLLVSLEPGRALPPTVIRDVVEWTPTLRVSGFRPFEILEKLSTSLDAVEQQIADAEEKVQVQKQALASGDLKALLPSRVARRPQATPRPAASSGDADAAGDDEADAYTPSPVVIAAVREHPHRVPAVEPMPLLADPSNPFDIFDVVEAVAATTSHHTTPTPVSAVPSADTALASRHAADEAPIEWEDQVELAAPILAPVRTLLFPALPPTR
jgi:hypothetical protein